jgi:hypothetical protein
MSLFEWFGERYNPGPVGSIDAETPGVTRNRPLSVVFFCTAVVVLGVWAGLLWSWTGADHWPWFATWLLVTLAYLLVAFFFVPRPDLSNVGLAGGLIDHPFRYSDDLNRTLLTFHIVLWPGRLLAQALVNPWRLPVIERQEAKEEADTQAERDALRDHVRAAFSRMGASPPRRPDDPA